MLRLRLTEIFYSLQGESLTVGLPTIFIRLTGCPLRCQYCDTAYAFSGGSLWEVEKILSHIKQYKTPYVTVTGGEPLAQKNCFPLLTQLCDAGYQVSLETSGAISLEQVDPRVVKVMDIKTPASGEVKKNVMENLAFLTMKDQIKLVICNKEDFTWAKDLLYQYQLDQVCPVLFSPSYPQLQANELADWILAEQLPVRMQIQLHKYLWGDVAGK